MSTTVVSPSSRIPLPFGLTGFGLAFLVVAAGGAAASLYWAGDALAFNTGAFANVAQVFAPLLLVATFVERAVEVILTPMRGARADMLQAELDQATKDPARQADAARLGSDMLNYKLHTRQQAFLLSSALGIFAALCGVRGMSALLQDPKAVSPWFRLLDVFMTGVVIGGGADGIHKIVNAILSYVDLMTRNAKAAGQ
jgi:hypothetical protein